MCRFPLNLKLETDFFMMAYFSVLCEILAQAGCLIFLLFEIKECYQNNEKQWTASLLFLSHAKLSYSVPQSDSDSQSSDLIGPEFTWMLGIWMNLLLHMLILATLLLGFTSMYSQICQTTPPTSSTQFMNFQESANVVILSCGIYFKRTCGSAWRQFDCCSWSVAAMVDARPPARLGCLPAFSLRMDPDQCHGHVGAEKLCPHLIPPVLLREK